MEPDRPEMIEAAHRRDHLHQEAQKQRLLNEARKQKQLRKPGTPLLGIVNSIKRRLTGGTEEPPQESNSTGTMVQDN